jgi:hypothetical protein
MLLKMCIFMARSSRSATPSGDEDQNADGILHVGIAARSDIQSGPVSA